MYYKEYANYLQEKRLEILKFALIPCVRIRHKYANRFILLLRA